MNSVGMDVHELGVFQEGIWGICRSDFGSLGLFKSVPTVDRATVYPFRTRRSRPQNPFDILTEESRRTASARSCMDSQETLIWNHKKTPP